MLRNQSSALSGTMVYQQWRQGRRRSSRLLYRSYNFAFENTDVLPRVMHCTIRGLHRAAECKDEYRARKPKTYKTLDSGLLNTLEPDAPAAQRAMSVVTQITERLIIIIIFG